MGPLGIKPPRLRVALIAVLSALALTAITAPGVASAADAETLTTMHCETDTPVAQSRMGCVVTVVPIFTEADGAPTGHVTFEADPALGDVVDPAGCALKDLGGGSNEAACSFVYETRGLGLQLLWANYSGGPGFKSGRGLYPIEPIQFGRITVTEPVCETVPLGSTGFCVVTVRDFFSGAGVRPLGPVTLTANRPVEFSSSSCELIPETTGSRCQIRYAPLALGPLRITAEYFGDPRVHRWSNGSITIPVKGVFQAP